MLTGTCIHQLSRDIFSLTIKEIRLFITRTKVISLVEQLLVKPGGTSTIYQANDYHSFVLHSILQD